MPKWSRRGAFIGFVFGDEEDELLVVVGAQHEATAVLGEVLVLLEAEHVAVERGDGGAAVGVERVGRHRHGDVVEPRRLRERGSNGHGFTNTFPAI